MKNALIVASLAAAGLALAYALQQKRRADLIAAGARDNVTRTVAEDLIASTGAGYVLNAFGFSF
jgi:hypothetical protein